MDAIQDHVNDDTVDVWRCRDTVRPLSDEEIPVLARLREVFRSSRKENVPSLKSRDQKKVMGRIYLINGLVGNISVAIFLGLK